MSPVDPRAVRAATDDPSAVAIIGMSCRASGVETLDDFWRLVSGAQRRFAEVPAGRWHGLDPGVGTPRASLLDRIDEFDARFFGIAPRMAAWMDPQHRLLLELAWHAVENAGRNPDDLSGLPVGVLVGGFMSDYRERMAAVGRADGAALPGTLLSFLANRVSYQFGWTGPSMVVDSACSSGLTALGLAVRGVQCGDYPMALVGATSVISAGFYANNAYRGGALSPSGRSVPYHPERDGYVRGEGGACLLIKPLRAALDDGDPVHGVIRAVGTAHNGRGGGLTGTDADSQERLTRRTVAAAGCRVGDLGYLEAHGTGTPGGDGVELVALARARDPEGEGSPDPARPGGRTWVGSVKANIGHLEAAAGLIGLVKTVLVVQHGVIPRVAGLDAPDPRLTPPPDGPVAIAVEDVPWPAGDGPRRAAVNSFGLGGALSQVVVEQAPKPTQSPTSGSGSAYPVPLSGPHEAAVRATAERLARALSAPPGATLAAVAWTQQSGRRAQSTRRVLLARDLDELRDALGALAAGQPHPRVLAVADRAVPADVDRASALAAVAWLRGDPVDWRELWGTRGPPERAALPGSYLDRRSHWFDRDVPGPAGG
ncbi:beta-ketoacyl synthase N-terminal-like domain-containing protein [Micromonospora sp. NPDC002296]|uniref:polyketide synthase n=1 Tax=Micromonospora sp. NPDC002296 TaxID=3154271 RepID=UPI0033326A8F